MFCNTSWELLQEFRHKATSTVLWVKPGRQLSTVQLLSHCPKQDGGEQFHR